MTARKRGRPVKRRVGRPAGPRNPDTQKQILDAAEEAFARVGFEGARIKDIADAAGVTKAMVHYYFNTKERLYQDILDRVLFELIKLVQDVSSKGGDRIQQLDNFILGFFDYVARHPHFARLGFAGGGAEERYFDTIIAQFFHPLLGRGVRFVDAGITEGTFQNTSAEMLFFGIYSIITGYFSDARFISLVLGRDATSAASVEIARDAVRQIFFRTLGLEAPPRTGAQPEASPAGDAKSSSAEVPAAPESGARKIRVTPKPRAAAAKPRGKRKPKSAAAPTRRTVGKSATRRRKKKGST